MELLDETVNVLKRRGLTPADVKYVSDENSSCSWDDFAKQARHVWYDNGYGVVEINLNLKVVGEGWWLEREEYDGAERWRYRVTMQRPPQGKIRIQERTF